jgi:hypothetical protein
MFFFIYISNMYFFLRMKFISIKRTFKPIKHTPKQDTRDNLTVNNLSLVKALYKVRGIGEHRRYFASYLQMSKHTD